MDNLLKYLKVHVNILRKLSRFSGFNVLMSFYYIFWLLLFPTVSTEHMITGHSNMRVRHYKGIHADIALWNMKNMLSNSWTKKNNNKNHIQTSLFIHSKKNFRKSWAKIIYFEKTPIILPTITISSKMFIDIKHLYVKKYTYNPGALLLCL